MDKNLKISIVSPSYNQGEYIEDAILSVLNQKYQNFEHIIIDGGSTDATLEIIKKYNHLTWVSERDHGQSDAINKGFKMATGDIIGWLNTDDVYTEGTFTSVSKHFIDDTLDAIYSDYAFTDKDMNITKKMTSHRPVKWLSLFHCYIPSTTFFFRRRIIDAGILIDKTKKIAMDKDFFANILFSGYKMKYVKDHFALFRWHDNNKSLELRNNLTKETRIIEGLEILNKYGPFSIPTNKLTQWLYYVFNDYLLKVARKIYKIKSH